MSSDMPEYPNQNNARRICAGLFIVYAGMMACLLFFQRKPSDLPWEEFIRTSFNLVPFRTIRQMLRLLDGRPLLARFALINLAGNVVMFVPLGLLPALWQRQRKFGWYFLTVAGAILLVELVQLVTTLGSADIDDWCLNMLGAIAGYGIWRLTVSMGHKAV